MSTRWNAKNEVQRESAERQVQGKCRKASADREPTTHVNTLGGYDHVRIYIQVPTAKFRTWSLRMIFEDDSITGVRDTSYKISGLFQITV